MMTLTEIRESGLLELYVIGELSPADVSEVQGAMAIYPVLKYDMAEIEATLKIYSDVHAVQPGDHVLEDILTKVNSANTPPSNTGKSGTSKIEGSSIIKPLKFAAIAASILFLGAAFLFFQQKNENAMLSERITICDEEQRNTEKELDLFRQINDPQNIVIKLESTEKYPSADMFLHSNPTSQRNFIQMMNLPQISDSQSYQLWSLKEGLAPIPLDVFENQTSVFLEVMFEQQTNVYAITVEPKGGRTEPTLENLVGTFKV